ncbi:hypothetical protein IZ6_11100 [Terrihabitans soli]|uniref:Uncharacterized protein n=1 Tax=Terrihabitans soli TaxID=708113 RepID=A0A6S6QRL1_9HYPH|nr:hypothetical protein [Terrihabitans soli]BCJ90375.1 hypothetical protein IZ6_11100 [Terrihabitans soli]
MDWLKLALGLLKAWNGLIALMRQWRDREAGRAEVIIEIKDKSHDALAEADNARAVQHGIDADDRELRRDDGHRRD